MNAFASRRNKKHETDITKKGFIVANERKRNDLISFSGSCVLMGAGECWMADDAYYICTVRVHTGTVSTVV